MGRVVFEGERPDVATIDPGPDACCQQAKPQDERWVIGPEGGLADVAVVVEREEGTARRPPGDPVVMRNDGCAFRPRVATVQVGQAFVMENADPATHNMNALLRRNGAFNLVLPPGDRREVVFERAESKPATISCTIHPFMRGYLIVLDHSHVSVTDKTGRFEIKGLEAGEATLRFWHEGRPVADAALVPAESRVRRTDARGRVSVVIDGDAPTDLGTLRVRFAGE